MARAQEIIAKKRDGGELKESEIASFLSGMLAGKIPDYQVSALLMACYLNGMTPEETIALTRAMVESGSRVHFDGFNVPTVDKHSTGGVGDKVSLPLGPLVAACGAAVPMIAGRGLGFTGGTLDKLEAIPGFRVGFSIDEFTSQVKKLGVAICGQTEEMAPADRKLYALRDVTATVDSVPLITASILSKKIVEGTGALVLDLKVGKGALMQNLEQARKLGESILNVGKGYGLKVRVVLTDMDWPLGRMVGNSSEVLESIELLRGNGEKRLTELVTALGGHMLHLAGITESADKGNEKITAAINDGSGLARFTEMVKAQGGDLTEFLSRNDSTAAYQETVVAKSDGFIKEIDARKIGIAAMGLGAGRARQADPIQYEAGIRLHAQVGDDVKVGDALFTAYTEEQKRFQAVSGKLSQAVTIAKRPVQPKPILLEIME